MSGRDRLRYMHKNAALINRGRIGHLIGHLIGLGTAHEFLRERIRGACTYAVITLVPRYTCYTGGGEGGRASGGRCLPRHRMPIASRIFPIFHLLSTLSLSLFLFPFLLLPLSFYYAGETLPCSLHASLSPLFRVSFTDSGGKRYIRVCVPSFSAITRNYL